MANFSKRSKDNLSTCTQDLQDLFNEIIKIFDCSILCGFRNEEDQNKAFENGKSHLRWPNSNHNKLPSDAVDVVPYPIDWDDLERFYRFAAFVFEKAIKMGIKVRWGGNWFNVDFPHWEIFK